MIDKPRTLLTQFIVRDLNRPRDLVIWAWRWLGAETDNHDEKRRCLEAVLELNPGSQAALAGSALLYQRELRSAEGASLADSVCLC